MLLSEGVEERITAEYVALAQRVGPIYNRFCHLGFTPFYMVANPSFAGGASVDIATLSALPSDRWTLPAYPGRPFLLDGDVLFEKAIVPLTVQTEIAPPSGGSVLCVPVYFSLGSLLDDKAWAKHPGGLIPRGVIRIGIMTLAKLFKFNNDQEGGIVYFDPVERVPVQITNSLLQYVAAGADEADPLCKLKFQRMATHASSVFKGLPLRRRTTPMGQPVRATVFDPVFGRPQLSSAATYRTSPVPTEAILPFPKDYEIMMKGALPE